MPTAQEALMTLLMGPSYKQRTVTPTEDYGFAGETPTQGELASPFEREQAARADAADAVDRKRAADATAMQLKETNLAKQQEQDQRDYELKKLLAVPQAQGANAIALEQEKNRGALKLQEDERKGKESFIQSMIGGSGGHAGGAGGAGGLNSGAPGSYKMSINASGNPAFQPVQMPALVQRAHGQLEAARDRTLAALSEAEKLYPGINDSAGSADTGGEPGWLSTLTGIGAPKYGSAASAASAANSRLKYTLGVPTPFARLAQEASFGNIEQMAGQLPGVRGLATIAPLFKEHQSRWGHETPLATVQRLRHMADIMDQTLQSIEGGAGSITPELQEQ